MALRQITVKEMLHILIDKFCIKARSTPATLRCADTDCTELCNAEQNRAKLYENSPMFAEDQLCAWILVRCILHSSHVCPAKPVHTERSNKQVFFIMFVRVWHGMDCHPDRSYHAAPCMFAQIQTTQHGVADGDLT